MVAILGKKPINTVHLESYTTYKEYLQTHKIKVPLDSFICYWIQKFCTSKYVAIRFVPVKPTPEQEKSAVTLIEEEGDPFIYLINEYEIPWTVELCVYPVIMVEYVIITGLCAVSRQISMFSNYHRLKEEQEDGLLGFRHTCLQAPNEVSVWTKFCEVEITRTAYNLINDNDIKEVPNALVRFEDHMKQPVRIHNVYKVAQDIKKESVRAEKARAEQQAANTKQLTNTKPHANAEDQTKDGPEKTACQQTTVEQENAKEKTNVEKQTNAEKTKQQEKLMNETKADAEQHTKSKLPTTVKEHANASHKGKSEQAEQKATSEQILNTEQQAVVDEQTPEGSGEGSSSTRTSKARKWKSNKNKEIAIDCSTKIEDLEVNHDFAEGPYLTLADLVLLPSYYIIIKTIGEPRFASVLPFTYKWYTNLMSIPRINQIFTLLVSQHTVPQLSINLHMPRPLEISLYKCDPKRHNPKKRIFTKEEDIEKALSAIKAGMELTVSENNMQPSFNWRDIPEQANPYSGFLPDTRVQRKSEQLENLAVAVLNMATDGDVIVDFCCGTGHLGILLAYLLPRCNIILLENKVQSLSRARERGRKMRLSNVFYYQCNLDYFIGEFDIGIGLHACGIATDLILEKCLKQNAKFVLSPCCYGAIHGTCRIKYPRSKMFSSVSLDEYLCIAHAADQTHKDHPLAVRGARCMTVIDSDRARLAEEHGYNVKLLKLKPVTCTPKNNLIIGISAEK